jgi:hypothetical protein
LGLKSKLDTVPIFVPIADPSTTLLRDSDAPNGTSNAASDASPPERSSVLKFQNLSDLFSTRSATQD